MSDEDEVVAKKKRTLLEKYDIPVHHLSYEYVEKCNDGKELERIVKILRSGEEGFFPKLVQCAEDRLKAILPNSRVLRVEEPVLTRAMLEPDQWNKVNNELMEWSGEMKNREQELQACSPVSTTIDLPAIRRGKAKDRLQTAHSEGIIEEAKKLKNVVTCDYSAWEKFDVDKELLKMDIEEERKREEAEKIQRQKQKEQQEVKKEEMSRIKVAEKAANLSPMEKKFLAAQEKDRGNEFYKECKYIKAVEHYTASIMLEPTPAAMNNRAIAYLKLHRYTEAMTDCSKVLICEPDNVKALMRRGIAYQNKNNYQKALEDFSKVVLLTPENKLARSLALQMEEKCDKRKKGTRMKITEEDSSTQSDAKIVELEEYVQEPCVVDPDMKENRSWPTMPRDGRVRYNNFGFAKVMCNCSGVPSWVRKPPPKCLVCKEIREKRKAAEENQKTEKSRVPEEISSESEDDCVCNHTGESEENPRTAVRHVETGAGDSDSNVIAQESGVKSESCTLNNVKQDLGARRRHSIDTDQEKGSGDSHSKEKKCSSRQNESKPKVAKVPEASGKVSKVQVASKYTCSISRGEESPVQEVEAIRSLSLEDCPAPRITTPFEFLNAWQAIRPNSDPAQFASVLRRVDPANLATLIGNKLDGTMLCTIVRCLQTSFLSDSDFVLNFLQQLSKLPRFTINKLFLNESDKLVLQKLFTSLEQAGCRPSTQLHEAYGV